MLDFENLRSSHTALSEVGSHRSHNLDGNSVGKPSPHSADSNHIERSQVTLFYLLIKLVAWFLSQQMIYFSGTKNALAFGS
jgi:hypothetical protein